MPIILTKILKCTCCLECCGLLGNKRKPGIPPISVDRLHPVDGSLQSPVAEAGMSNDTYDKGIKLILKMYCD